MKAARTAKGLGNPGGAKGVRCCPVKKDGGSFNVGT